jgi:hypothetical protein
MVEFLALNRDVAPDGRSCGFAISFFQCSHDSLVLGHGLRQAPSCPELHAAEGLKAPVKPEAFLLQKPVAGLPVQNGVEAFVFQVIAIGVLSRDRFITTRVGSMKVAKAWSVMRLAARRAQTASNSAITSNISRSSTGPGWRTKTPRRGICSTRPDCDRRCKAFPDRGA